MIKALIFDCFGVLTTDLWKEFVASLPNDQIKAAYDINHAYDSGLCSAQQFRQQIIELTGRNPGEVENIPASQIHKNEKLLTYIASLKSSYRIGLLSNVATNWIRHSFLTADERSLFDSFTFSYQVGIAKPDERIFRLAAEALDCPPENCVMIDDIRSNCLGAQRVGMAAIEYKNFPQVKTELEKLLALASA